MGFGEKYTTLWQQNNPATNEHAKLFLSELLLNRKEAIRQWIRLLYLFILLAALFILLSQGNSREVTLFSVKITDIQVLQLVLPTIMAFVNYQSICALFFAEQLRELIDAYLRVHLKPVCDKGLELAIDAPTFFNIERFFSRANLLGAGVAAFFGTSVAVVLLLAPLVLCIGFICVNFYVSSHIAWKVVCAVLPAVFLARSVFLGVTLFIEDSKSQPA